MAVEFDPQGRPILDNPDVSAPSTHEPNKGERKRRRSVGDDDVIEPTKRGDKNERKHHRPEAPQLPPSESGGARNPKARADLFLASSVMLTLNILLGDLMALRQELYEISKNIDIEQMMKVFKNRLESAQARYQAAETTAEQKRMEAIVSFAQAFLSAAQFANTVTVQAAAQAEARQKYAPQLKEADDDLKIANDKLKEYEKTPTTDSADGLTNEEVQKFYSEKQAWEQKKQDALKAKESVEREIAQEARSIATTKLEESRALFNTLQEALKGVESAKGASLEMQKAAYELLAAIIEAATSVEEKVGSDSGSNAANDWQAALKLAEAMIEGDRQSRSNYQI